MRVVAISDTHMSHEGLELPEGDLLVHCGDWCRFGSGEEREQFVAWLAAQPHPHKVFVAGNHDLVNAESRPEVPPGVTYLEDEALELEGKRIYGSPWTPRFGPWAFMKERQELGEVWARIPAELDLLITHGPPYGHGDLVNRGAFRAGCLALLQAVLEKAPRHHVYGHIHEGYGVTRSDLVGTVFWNAASVGGGLRIKNPPHVFEI